ncbi:serine/threonine-protein kinase Warts [Agrilus planipennis]|uniref:non-specific serine/threonine protein kinase n=1 Tax=Agrilus planipennis TaxID=224129 RepID=A0A1W4WT35_AGRPL|nr:serine/threonine-protein kinase Warts [Agrilus planipennis]
MGQQPQSPLQRSMNPSTPSARSSGYHQKAMEEIHNSLLPFAKSSGSGEVLSSSAASSISTLSATSGVSSMSTASGSNGTTDLYQLRQMLAQLLTMGYSEDCSVRALQISGFRLEGAIDYLLKQQLDANSKTSYKKLIRKPSIERELGLRGSPAVDSGAGSSRSDSPRLAELHPPASRQYSPSNFNEPPPPPPPRNTPPPPPPHVAYQPVPSNVQQLFKRMSPAPALPSRAPPAPPYSSTSSQQRGTSPVSSISSSSARQPMVVQNGPQVQQQLSQQIQALSLYQSTSSASEPPPPYPLIPQSPSVAPPPPPSYSASIQNRQSPTQDFRKSPSSGIYSGGTSAGSPSPIPVATTTPTALARPTPLQAWGARQAKTQPPIIMQSVKSTQVQKPILQTAIAPTSPQISASPTSTTPPAATVPPPSYTASIQQKHQQQQQQQQAQHLSKPVAALPTNVSPSSTTNGNNTSPLVVPTTEPPSYASTMQAKAEAKAKAVQRGIAIPPLPYSTGSGDDSLAQVATVESGITPRTSPQIHAPLQRKYSPAMPSENIHCRSDSPHSASSSEGRHSIPDLSGAPPLPPTLSSSVTSKNKQNVPSVNGKAEHKENNPPPPQLPPYKKIKHQSPIPERKKISKEKEEERRDGKVKNYSPQAFKFFMEQHIENVIKAYRQRIFRRLQLENEMTKIGLSPEAQCQMRKMLSQKESNYIRLKRAKMDKSMFTKIKPIGVGAFGEVTLVRKIDTNHLYAMKTLRKADVLKRNQVAHVKAERDILAEADNEWVVKLYYSFQDSDVLYFVMDYIPGGDLMSLLIKLGVFEEPLARFYVAELTCAIESVHNMGFIHRDIKPDNILIDRDGHIKLTDFGLCTGFRWTHNSKYYQPNGDHSRQDSMEPMEDWNNEECRCKAMKPLERRRRQEHQRCLAHSLVGTPNYIAPEVLQRTGYTQLCDWWSVGVILYEMLVGSPPFLANTPAETQFKVINWETTLHIPKQANLSKESTDLILKLCTNADKRLGKNATEVKAHPFFSGIDFEKGLRRQPAPHIPKIDYPTDTSNFDPVDPDKLRNSNSIDSSASDEILDSSRPFHGFFEFTFRRFFDDGGGPVFNRINLDDTSDNQGPVYV